MGLAVVSVTEAEGATAAHFRVHVDSENGCYDVGGKAVVEVTIEEEGRLPEGPVEAWVDDGWTNVVWRRTVDMSAEPTFKMELTRATPGSLRIHLKAKGMAERLDRLIFGVNDIKPLTPCPDDFEAYWKGERERLERDVPIAVKGKVMTSLHDHQTNAIQQHGLTVILDERYKSPRPLCSCVGPSGMMSSISVPLAPSTQ